MAIEVLAFVNPMAPPPANPILQIPFYILLTPVGIVLQFFDQLLQKFGPTAAIGAFGLAIILLTLAIRGLLFPLFRWQITTQWKVQAQQRVLAPELKLLQQKYKKDRQRLNSETMELYKRHGVSPLSQLSGCLPLLIQMPFIYALYGSINKLSHGLHGHTTFLWIPELNDVAFKVKGGIVGHPLLLLVPLLAGLFTFMQSKMMMQPVRPDMTDSERQMYRVMSQTTYLMPVVVAFFALNFSQGVGLYWITQSLIMVIQVFTMMGWGGLRVPPWFPGYGWSPRNSPMTRFALQYDTGGSGGSGGSGPQPPSGAGRPGLPSGGSGSSRPARQRPAGLRSGNGRDKRRARAR